MPKPIKKRVQKTNVAEREVISLYEKFADYYLENKKTVYLGAALAVLFIAIVTGLLIYNKKITEQAATLQYEGYKLYHNLYQEDDKKTDEVVLKKALEKFQEAYDKKKSPITLLYIANTQFALGLGENEEALKTLEKFTKKYSGNKELLPLAYYKIAAIQMKEGRKEEALKTLDTLYNLKTSPFLKDVALHDSASILEKMGRKEEALKKYEQLAKEYPQSPYYQLAITEVKKEAEEKMKDNENNKDNKKTTKKEKP
ncbi:MAG: tetratricopeptide repeat protein [Nitrospirae bacterium]|nr:tetratricopeptide repeat protein [Nitrospirota bacterium]